MRCAFGWNTGRMSAALSDAVGLGILLLFLLGDPFFRERFLGGFLR
jgi:hypothetical protein